MPGNKLWQQVYRRRMSLGLEDCRACNKANADTLGHLLPASQGGPRTLKNITLLCFSCNQLQADTVWPWLVSLYDEEKQAPPEERWSRVAWGEEHRDHRLCHRMDLSSFLDKLVPSPDWC